VNGTNYEVPHYEALSTPHSHTSWAQIFASGSFFQMPLAFFPPLMYEHSSHPYITVGNIMILHILIFKFLERSREDKSVWTE
jgi:hypothetical protein